MSPHPLGVSVTLLAALTACGPSNPCGSSEMHLRARFSQPYVDHWVVARGDTLTLPELGDRFKLTDVILDSARVAVSGTCRFKGALVFAVPRAETLAVTWYGSPEQALIYGWPVDLGPFAGVGASRVGDSLVGAILFDSQLGVQVRPGVTARFVAGRARGALVFSRHERVPLPPRDHGARVVGGGDHRPGRAD